MKYAIAHWATQLGGRVKIEPRRLQEQGPGPQAPPRSGRRRRRPVAAAAAAGKGKAGAAEVKVGGRRREGKVFDLFIWGLGKPIALDVTVVHPLAPSHVQDSADNPGSALKKAEAEKHWLYDGLADRVGAEFFAFAVETTGRLGDEALAFIRRLIQEGARFKHVWAPKQVVQGIYRSVAVAVARGNADIVRSNLAATRLATWEDQR